MNLLPLVTHSRFVVRVRRDLHQRHDRDAEEAAEHQPDDETDHYYPSPDSYFSIFVNIYLYSIILISHYNYAFMLYNTIYSAPNGRKYKIC